MSTSLGDSGGALLLVDSLEELVVLLLVSDLLGVASSLLVELLTAAAKSDGGDKTLDLGGNSAVALTLLTGDGTADDELTDVVLLGQVEELADAGSTLGTETLRDSLVSDVGNLLLSLLNDDNVDDGHLRGDDASTNRLSTTITLAAVGVVSVGSVQKEADSVGGQHSLLHGETLLVESSSDAENVSLVLVAQEIAVNVLTDALVVEGAVALLLVNFVHLGGARGGVGNVDLWNQKSQYIHASVFSSFASGFKNKKIIFHFLFLGPFLLNVPSWPMIYNTIQFAKTHYSRQT